MLVCAGAGRRTGAVSPHDHVLSVGVSIGPLLLRVLLLAAIPVVAGFALLRGFLAEPGRVTATAVAGVAGGAVVLELMLAGGLDLPAQAVPLVLAALAGPVYVTRSRNPRFAGLASRLRMIAPWILGLAGTIAVVEFARAVLGGGPAATVRLLLHTGVVLALTGLAWFVVCRPRTRIGTAAVRVIAAVLAIALAGGVAQAAVLRSPPPVPGVATIHQAAIGSSTVDVLVVPNRPGWNLVHVAGEGAEVGTDPDHLVPAESRAGTTGAWAAVRLPPGRSGLWIRYGGNLGAVTTDTGAGAPAPDRITG
ncbi:MAG TPA: DUF6239 family natural product biosynthesis protein, partial [Actinophytocola sp.]|uniref:DUF6239 family natural product biosynthesis protein n=1 Tax=Actinophytocola sp. TaxID=1872138 RepID=UPI002DDCA1BD